MYLSMPQYQRGDQVGRLVFHIGVHKTASTTIQAFLRSNGPALGDMGIYLPLAGCLDAPAFANVHNIAWQLLAIDLFKPELGTLEQLIEELHRAAPTIAILSAEDLEFLTLEQIRGVADAFHGYEKTALVYLRRHDDLLVSEYSHQLREGVTYASFEDWYATSQADPRYDYVGLLSRWRQAGFDVRVRPFESEMRNQKDICFDFLEALDIDARHFMELKTVDAQNVRLPGRVTILLREVMSRADRVLGLGTDAKGVSAVVWWHLLQFLPGGPEFNPISGERRKQLVDSYSAMYSQIEADYLDGKEILSRALKPVAEFGRLDQLTPDEVLTGLGGIIGSLWRRQQQPDPTKPDLKSR